MPSSSKVTCMDFDAKAEIWRFFSQFTINGTTAVRTPPAVNFSIYPNPTQGQLHLRTEGRTVTRVTIMDMQGRVVERLAQENIRHIDLRHLSAGSYLAVMEGDDLRAVKRFTVAHTDE